MAESELLMVAGSELDGRESISSACTELTMDDGRLITSRLWAVESTPRLLCRWVSPSGMIALRVGSQRSVVKQSAVGDDQDSG